MKKPLFVAFLLSLIFTSCSILNNTNVKKVELGMSKTQVIKIMGNNYKVMALERTPDGTLEVIGYIAEVSSYMYYTFYFLDGTLDKILKEWIGPPTLPASSVE